MVIRKNIRKDRFIHVREVATKGVDILIDELIQLNKSNIFD